MLNSFCKVYFALRTNLMHSKPISLHELNWKKWKLYYTDLFWNSHAGLFEKKKLLGRSCALHFKFTISRSQNLLNIDCTDERKTVSERLKDQERITENACIDLYTTNFKWKSDIYELYLHACLPNNES